MSKNILEATGSSGGRAGTAQRALEVLFRKAGHIRNWYFVYVE